MKAIVLAAGYGTRLYPLTKDVPKPLIDVAGRPIIEHILFGVANLPVDEVLVVTNAKFFAVFEQWLSGFSFPVPVRLLNDGSKSNEDRLGAVGDIDFAVRSAGVDDEVLVVGGDNLFEFSLLDLYGFFRSKRASVVALHDLGDRSKAALKYGVADVDADLRIVDFEEKPASPKTSLASTACYFFTRSDLAELERCIQGNRKPDNLGDFVKWLSSRRHVYGFVFSEKWFDIGSHEQLAEADAYWKRF